MCPPPPNLPKAGEEMENFTSLFCSTEIEKAPSARGLRRQVVGERQQFYMLSPSVRFAASALTKGAFHCFSFIFGLASSSKLRFCVKNRWYGLSTGGALGAAGLGAKRLIYARSAGAARSLRRLIRPRLSRQPPRSASATVPRRRRSGRPVPHPAQRGGPHTGWTARSGCCR